MIKTLARRAQKRSIITYHKPSYEETQVNRNFFLTILGATVTKRDARAYIERYSYTHAKPPIKRRQTIQEFFEDDQTRTVKAVVIRTALVLIRDANRVQRDQLKRIGHTLGQLSRLGLLPIVILDTTSFDSGHAVLEFAQILEDINVHARPILDGLFGIQRPMSMHLKRTITLENSNILLSPLLRRQIPILRTIGVSTQGQKSLITADSASLAIAADFSRNNGVVVDKVILIDDIGGPPSPSRKGGSHVFINLDQEATHLLREISLTMKDADRHLRNLDTARRVLGELPDHASGIILTPNEAGSEGGEGLIYNLLADKPIISPSLPTRNLRTPITTTTILRKGVNVKVLKDVKLDSDDVELDKLVNLMNDSFARKLDVEGYLSRVSGGVSLIIAGDYAGAAIITTESGIPYLDKFAVLRAKQGSGGVADVLFNALVATFPEELLWRSRGNNPVNKWYFERAKGTLMVPGTQWRLFFTTPKVDEEKIRRYVEIAKSIQPTWLS